MMKTIRAGLTLRDDAANSWLRLEARLKRRLDVNSSFRDPVKQLKMFNAWNAWVGGWGPKPNHGRAIHPDYSMHCQGLAVDTDDDAILRPICEEYGWVFNVRDEKWHCEYRPNLDRHKNDGVPAGTSKPKPATTPARRKGKNVNGVIYTDDKADKNRSGAIVNTETGLFSEFGWFPVAYANGVAVGFGLAAAAKVTRGHYNSLKADMAALRTRLAQAGE